ncbi:MAG TPA: hypothetical protein P5567_03125 [Kiritimatiellia bacterium]|nr:hypothetical protein [Kiritimatiellia bacterium]HSA17023.1 hypothetical protein [Kiritimatiellia bacterium]
MAGRRILLLLVIGLAACARADWPFAPPDPGQSWAQDHVIVRFRTRAVAQRLGRSLDVNPGAAEKALGLPAGAAVAGVASLLRGLEPGLTQQAVTNR